MKFKKRLFEVGFVLLGFKLLEYFYREIPTQYSAFMIVIGFSMASVGFTEYLVGDKNKKIKMKELVIDILLIISIILALTQLFPFLTFGENVFIKQAFFMVN